MAAVSRSSLTSCRTIPPTSIPGSSKAAVRATMPKRDWYIWRDPGPDGGPPNNWLSEFGGSAWQHDAATGQYYYHAFLAQQPDLNWRNPAVREAIYEVMRFWLGKGVDGFRVDVIWHLIKDAQFRDNPPNPHYHEGRPPHEKILTRYSTDQPEVHDVIAEMRQRHRRIRMPRSDRRNLSAGSAAGRLLRQRSQGRPDAVQLCAAVDAVERPLDRADRCRLRSGPACKGVAELGARQSRSSAGCKPGRAGPGPRRGDAAADLARHADALLWRRDWHASGPDRARTGAGSL